MKILQKDHGLSKVVDKVLNKDALVESENVSEEKEERSHKHGLIKNALTKHGKLVGLMRIKAMKILKDLKIFESVENIVGFLARNPLIALPVCGLLMLVGIPLLSLIIFAFISSSVTFMGFVILEGTIVATGAIILGGILVVTFGTLTMIAIIISIIYLALERFNIIK